MKVLLAGATGMLAGPLMTRLLVADHEVIGIARTSEGAEVVRARGGRPIIADVLNREALSSAVRGLSADAVIHELTALRKAPVRHSDMTVTNALRTTGTAHLLEAARAIGARRFVTQSIVFGYGFIDHGDRELTERSPFGGARGDAFDPTVDALADNERQVLNAGDIDGVALRYGLFYGADIGVVERMLRRRSLPVARHGGLLSFVHHDDAAAATVAALDRGRAGQAYNVVDDGPATFRDVAEAIAVARATPRPLVLPRRVLELAAPYGGVVLGRVSMRVSNEKARSELEWEPRYPSYREGVRASA